MKKWATLIIMLLFVILVAAKDNSIYDFKVSDIDGNEFDFSTLKGKKVLIVNVASECGLTPQYSQLQELYDKYKNKGFTIVAFPSNDFGGQEPGSNSDIKRFCSDNYNVTFPVMSKIKVKGEDQSPIYQWLTNKSINGVLDCEVTWNFQKFMIDKNGNLVGCIEPREGPLSPTIIDWVSD